jgi:hypothetical protein
MPLQVLAPMMALAERTGLSELVTAMVAINHSRMKSSAVNPAGKITSITAGIPRQVRDILIDRTCLPSTA